MGTMPIASDIILDWIHEDGCSLSAAGWIRPQDQQFYFEVTAGKDGHQHIARAPDRSPPRSVSHPHPIRLLGNVRLSGHLAM